jgi:hypothetical protein
MPVWANFTMIGAGTLVAGFPADGNGGVWRRGTGGTVYNGVLSRFTGTGINIRDAWTDSLWIGSGGKDSLWISNTLLAQNAANLDNNYAAQANWNAGRYATMLQYASDVHGGHAPRLHPDAALAQLQAEGRVARHHWRPDRAAGARDLPHRRGTSVAPGSTRRTSVPLIRSGNALVLGWTVYETN